MAEVLVAGELAREERPRVAHPHDIDVRHEHRAPRALQHRADRADLAGADRKERTRVAADVVGAGRLGAPPLGGVERMDAQLRAAVQHERVHRGHECRQAQPLHVEHPVGQQLVDRGRRKREEDVVVVATRQPARQLVHVQHEGLVGPGRQHVGGGPLLMLRRRRVRLQEPLLELRQLELLLHLPRAEQHDADHHRAQAEARGGGGHSGQPRLTNKQLRETCWIVCNAAGLWAMWRSWQILGIWSPAAYKVPQ